MAWNDEPTRLQIGNLAYMVGNLRNPRFTEDEKNQFLSAIRNRRDASEAMGEVRKALACRCDPAKMEKDGKWYGMLLKLSQDRRNGEEISNLEKLIREHPNSAIMGIWMKELRELKEENEKRTGGADESP